MDTPEIPGLRDEMRIVMGDGLTAAMEALAEAARERLTLLTCIRLLIDPSATPAQSAEVWASDPDAFALAVLAVFDDGQVMAAPQDTEAAYRHVEDLLRAETMREQLTQEIRRWSWTTDWRGDEPRD